MKRLISTLALSMLTITAMADEQLPMKLWYNTKATFFEESLPIGNGKIGALVYGGSGDNIIYLNDITLWTGKPVNHNDDADAHTWIPKIRQALFKEDYETADKLQLHVEGNNSQFFKPLGILHIEDKNDYPVSNYYRELDIDNAVCSDRFDRGGIRVEREYLASYPDKVIAMKIKADKKNALNYDIRLSSLMPHLSKAKSEKKEDGSIGMASNEITMTGSVDMDPENGIHFCTILHLVSDGKIEAADSMLTLRDATEAVIYIVNETSFNGYDKHPVKEGAPYIDLARSYMDNIARKGYEEIKSRQQEDYHKIYDRFRLNLGGSVFLRNKTTEQQLKEYTDNGGGNPYLETLYMQYGRYLLISSSRTPGVPANLQGLWSPHISAPWRGNYTVNINLEENYWPAFVSNMAEMATPLDNFIRALADNGHYTAKNYYGVEHGWCSSHNSDIWAMTNPVGEKRESPKWSCWNLGGAWLVNTLWERYLYTGDIDYLNTVAYPLMKGAAEFCLDWLVPNPKNYKELITAPSTSPESEFITDKGYKGTTCYGGTADLAIIRELFKNTRMAAAILGQDNDLKTKIEAAQRKLHPYTVGHMGDLNEWYYDWDDEDFQHRHQSHLIGLYPGNNLPTSLHGAAEKSLEIKGDQTTGWSTGWRINLWARLKKAQEAYHIYQKLLTYVSPDKYDGPDRRRSGGTYPNLFDAHPPFQIDGNFGGTAGVCEMLLQSHDGTIELLPALPDEWASGSVKGICARGGYEIDMEWKDKKITSAVIKTKKKAEVNIRFNGQTKRLKLKKSGSFRVL